MKFLIFFFTAFLFVFTSFNADALTVGPVKFNITAEHGEKIKQKIILFNESENTVTLEAKVENVTFAPGEKGVPIPAGIYGKNSLANWIQLSKKVVALTPKERVEIPFTVKIPDQTPAGGYYARIAWSPIQKTGSDIKAINRIGSLVLARVEGEVKENAQVVFFGNEKGTTRYEKMPISFNARIQNTGTVHVAPVGEVRILNYKGKTLVFLPFNLKEEVSYILPGETRAFSVPWDDGFRFGKYTAVLDVKYGESAQDLRSEYTFWIIPTYLLLAWLVVAILVIVLCIDLAKKASLPKRTTQ